MPTKNPSATFISPADRRLIERTLEQLDALDALYGPRSPQAERLLFALEDKLARSLDRRHDL